MKLSLLSIFALGTVLSAAPVTVTFVNGGNPGESDSRGYPVGPYTLTVNGVNVAAMCMDDFKYSSGTWEANVTEANSRDLSNTYLHNGSTSVGGTKYYNAQIYKAEAYLFSQIIKPDADRVSLQDAAWAIMDPDSYKYVYSSKETTVENDIHTALKNAPTFDASAFGIITEAGGDSQQEFIYSTATPEPASVALLAGGLLMGALTYWKRRRSQAVV